MGCLRHVALPTKRDFDGALTATQARSQRDPDQEKKSIPLVRHGFHGDWNYNILPSTE